MRALRNTSATLALAGALGCAPAVPPQDLVTARVSYGRASHGVAATLDPVDLHAASDSLAAAEQSFAKNGATPETTDLAYVADRRSQIAEARGASLLAAQQKQQTVGEMHAAETAQVQATSAQLGRANVQLAVQDQQLQIERERRADADKRAAQAAADLAAFASVKQEPRGMVITLSGSVLFATNRADLLPTAQAKLNDVAMALTKQDAESKMIVEGHTDSQGNAEYNQE
ncbi:MAG: DUF4398 domain-containing protein, partial [Myxococcota bacterium]|nr:DUF4398 domain-containing protein [Myxococcota bacterium]